MYSFLASRDPSWFLTDIIWSQTLIFSTERIVDQKNTFLFFGISKTVPSKTEFGILGEKPGLVVREEDSRPRGRGFESHRILDECKLLHIQWKEKE